MQIQKVADTTEFEHRLCSYNGSDIIKEGIVDLKASYNIRFSKVVAKRIILDQDMVI